MSCGIGWNVSGPIWTSYLRMQPEHEEKFEETRIVFVHIERQKKRRKFTDQTQFYPCENQLPVSDVYI